MRVGEEGQSCAARNVLPSRDSPQDQRGLTVHSADWNDSAKLLLYSLLTFPTLLLSATRPLTLGDIDFGIEARAQISIMLSTEATSNVKMPIVLKRAGQ